VGVVLGCCSDLCGYGGPSSAGAGLLDCAAPAPRRASSLLQLRRFPALGMHTGTSPLLAELPKLKEGEEEKREWIAAEGAEGHGVYGSRRQQPLTRPAAGLPGHLWALVCGFPRHS